ncbi:peptidylprolyl isomerase, partial [Escherichia coli]|nr:peptidylprolyl isomerase [Escherichia coli]
TSSAAGESWKVVEAASRGHEGVDPKLLQAVFRMQRPEAKDKPSFSGVTLANGDYVVIRLNGVSEPEEAISDDEKAMYRRFLASRSGQADFAAFRRQLQDKAEVEKY